MNLACLPLTLRVNLDYAFFLAHLEQYQLLLCSSERPTAVLRLKDVEGSEPLYRLITTILDHEQAPAKELAALYHERWEIETTLDELKTHLRGAQIVLRSKTPELVRQEFFGLLMAHFAIRGLMHEAALKADEDPDRLSFVHSVHVVQRRMARYGAIPPSAKKSATRSDPR
jgi:IS4 transposase